MNKHEAYREHPATTPPATTAATSTTVAGAIVAEVAAPEPHRHGSEPADHESEPADGPDAPQSTEAPADERASQADEQASQAEGQPIARAARAAEPLKVIASQGAGEHQEVVDHKAAAKQQAQSAAALADLERRIRDLEAAIGDLRTVAAASNTGVAAAADRSGRAAATGRKTQPSYAAQLLGKGGEGEKRGSVDAALGSLSVEQRLAVKAGLLRAGLL